MAIFAKCCFCELKTGNVVLGCLILLSALIVLGNSVYEINLANAVNELSQYDLSEALAQFELTEEDFYNTNNLLMVSACMNFVSGILSIPASICLIIGTLKTNRQLIAVYLVVEGVDIVLIFLKILIISIMFGFDLIVLISCLITACITIFIWLFPLSLYQDLQDSSAGEASSSPGGQVDYTAQTQSYAGGASSSPGGQDDYTAQTQSYTGEASSSPGGQDDYTAQTQSYAAVPKSMTYLPQGKAHKPQPRYPTKY